MKNFDFNQVLTSDSHRLKVQQRQIRNESLSERREALFIRFQEAFQRSHQKYLKNKEALPKPKLNADLPVLQQQEKIKKLIAENQVVIISGETGSGKTTQLPQICLSLGLGARGLIAHTQPRRIAARTVASRIAEELEVPLGGAVGYQVRFEEALSPETRIKLMTDGLLLAETNKDKYLSDYEVIIVDEAHERSLNIDFLLGYLRQLMNKRKDLKIIITSATIDAEKFAKHFDNAPTISVSGRTYPVEIVYQPPAPEQDLNEQILEALHDLDQRQRGDVLIFFATEREILDCTKFLEKQQFANTEILPLFGRLSLSAQQAVFHPKGKRRIVLTTNVAETSLTVPRIRYVIDTGTARISRYSLRTKTQRLPIEAISQASANQRAGRCGRLSAGVCIRLYSLEDFKGRPEYTEPEILRTNLASVILQMLVLNLGEVADFPFVDVPDQRQINDGYRLLFELQAVDEYQKLTPLGRKMAKLPIDPRFARIVFGAEKSACVQEILIILAFLSLQDVRERPLGSEALADQRQGEFADEVSDFQTIVNLFLAHQEAKHQLSNNGLRQWYKHYFLNPPRMREWRELVNQLVRDCREDKIVINPLKSETLSNQPEGKKGRLAQVNTQSHFIHEALLTGFLDQIGLWDEKKQDYLGTRTRRFKIFPASVLAKKKPATIMAGSIVETQQVYARMCAPIDFAVVERLAKHLTKSQLNNPHWSKKAGNVMAEETVSLYGLPLISGRKKPYGQHDPVLANRIFIEEALVTGEINTRLKVIADNQNLINKLNELEERTRNRSILDEQAIGEFYYQRLPESVFSTVTLEQWVKKHGEEALLMTEAHLLHDNAQTDTTGYPEALHLHGYRFGLEYEFNPSSEADGVTILVPITALNVLQNQDLERLVPAMLYAKIEALLRRLPKVYRRMLVPIPPFAQAIYERIKDSKKPLIADICKALEAMKGLKIPPEAFDLEAIDAHHLMNIRLLDGKKVVAESRDLEELKDEFGTTASETFQNRSVSQLVNGEAVKQWQWEQLPKVERLKGNIVAFPALTVEEKGLFLRLHDNEERANQAHRLGLIALFHEYLSAEIKYLQKNIPNLSQSNLYYCKISQSNKYFDDLIYTSIESACLLTANLPRSQLAFNEALQNGKNEVIKKALELNEQLSQILKTFSQINERLRSIKNSPNKEDMVNQINGLIYPQFIRNIPAKRFKDILRYLNALNKRLDKFQADPFKDFKNLELLRPFLDFLNKNPQNDEFFWLLQEYRVQLFAQELGTAIKVSPKRLEELMK